MDFPDSPEAVALLLLLLLLERRDAEPAILDLYRACLAAVCDCCRDRRLH